MIANYRLKVKKVRYDLDEAMIIAEPWRMGFHQADCYSGYARLYLDMGDKGNAWEHFAKAKEMIGKKGGIKGVMGK